MKIACIGNITRDCIVRYTEFIKEGFKNSFIGAEYGTGGPSSTAASVIRKYGLDVDFYGQVGKDANGVEALTDMKKEGINLSHVNISNNIMTPHSFIMVSGQKRTICSVRSEEDFRKRKIEDITYDTGYDYILTDGKYPLDTLRLMRANPGAISIIDAGRTDEKTIELCGFMNYIICSEEFANKVTGIKISNDLRNMNKVYNILKNKFPFAKAITITVGEKGYICEKDSSVINMPAYDLGSSVVDTTGAGDIFHGAFTYALADNNNYYDSLEFANVCAALSTLKKGGRCSIPELRYVKNGLENRIMKLKK